MYILFYPLKFPSTPMLILFKVLQHHNNLLWPRTGLEPAFIHRYRDYLQTCAYFLIQHLAARDTVSPPVRLCILHTPLRSGATFPFAYQVIWSGRQDSNLRPLVRSVYKIRTYDTSFIIQTHQFLSLLVNCNQNQCSSQLNYFPKLSYKLKSLWIWNVALLPFQLFICSAQQNRTAIPRMKILWPDR